MYAQHSKCGFRWFCGLEYVSGDGGRGSRGEDTGRYKLGCAKPHGSVLVTVVRAWLRQWGRRVRGWVSHHVYVIVWEKMSGAGVWLVRDSPRLLLPNVNTGSICLGMAGPSPWRIHKDRVTISDWT